MYGEQHPRAGRNTQPLTKSEKLIKLIIFIYVTSFLNINGLVCRSVCFHIKKGKREKGKQWDKGARGKRDPLM